MRPADADAANVAKCAVRDRLACDEFEAAARRLEGALWNDPAIGVMRHADAGHDEAIQCANEMELKLPSLR